MANPTRQSMAAGGINDLLALQKQFAALRRDANEFVTRYGGFGYSAIWNAMPTAAVNADGTFGAADGLPNNAHPIDSRVVSGMQNAMAANDLINGVAMLQALQAFLGNGVVATANRNAVLDLFQQG